MSNNQGGKSSKNTKAPQQKNEQTPMVTYLPEDTRKVLEGRNGAIDNFYLALNKVIRLSDDKFKLPSIYPKFDDKLITQLATRNKRTVEGLGGMSKTLTFHVTDRMALGLGHHSVYENSVTLHPLYGIPYIPASSLKGLVRNTVIVSYFGEDEEKAEQDADFRFLFGSQEERGHIHFYDAFPTNTPHIAKDILTPHYTNYYNDETRKQKQPVDNDETRKQKQPVDYDKVKPINFLVVKKAIFQLIFGIHGQRKEHSFQQEAWKGKTPLDVIEQEIRYALQEMGIGAKTAIGYGYGKVKETK